MVVALPRPSALRKTQHAWKIFLGQKLLDAIGNLKKYPLSINFLSNIYFP